MLGIVEHPVDAANLRRESSQKKIQEAEKARKIPDRGRKRKENASHLIFIVVLPTRTREESDYTSQPFCKMATIKCAPSKNLNSAFPHFATAKEVYAHLLEITAPVSNRFSLLQCVG
jgi:hypothetical protein